MSGAAVEIATWLVLGYVVLLNAGYLLLNIMSVFALRRGLQDRVIEELPYSFGGMEPAISVVVPAFNEEATIVASVRSMLQLAYAEFEIMVVNDGSTDSTLTVLQDVFELETFPGIPQHTLPTETVRGFYRSRRHPQLWVIDKDNGGKADALNAGIAYAHHPLFCGVDADSILARDSLRKVVKPFLRDVRVVASGGTVRVANGCRIEAGQLMHVALPTNPWAMFQVVEYLRAFLFGRLGWSQLNAMLIISGAFGLFRTDVVVAAGGYRRGTIGEDMELVVRLHRLLRARGIDYLIEFVPDPVCWTQAPEDRSTLRNQRIRWQRGLCESLAANWRLMLSRRGGAVGWLAFPFMILFEALGPLIELAGYVFMLFAWLCGAVSWEAFAAFLTLAVGLGVLLSASALLLEEMAYHVYPRAGDIARLAGIAIAENFGYRQLTAWWRLVGLYRWAAQRESTWGAMRRRSWQQP